MIWHLKATSLRLALLGTLALIPHRVWPQISLDNTSPNHRDSVRCKSSAPGNSTSKGELKKHFYVGHVISSCFLARQTIGLYIPTEFKTRMPMTIYSYNQHLSVMANTGLPRAPDSPGALSDISQASTRVASRYSTNPKDPLNPANNVNIPVDGWPTLVKIVAQKPDLEAFASFTDLNIKSLLYYQAELIYLRKKLHKVEWRDFRTSNNENSSSYAENLEFLMSDRDDAEESKENGDEEPEPMPEQWILIEKIRKTLDKYNKALLQFSGVAALRDADRCNITTLMGCVQKVGKEHTALTGVGAYTWGDYNANPEERKPLQDLFWGLFTGFSVSPDGEPPVKDREFKEHLVVPRQGKKPDGLTQWVTRSFIPFYERMRKEEIPYGKKYQKYLLPLWVILVLLRLIVVSLWRVFRLLCHKLLPKLPHTDPEKTQRHDSNASSVGNLSEVPSANSNATNDSKTSNESEYCITNSFIEYSSSWIVRVTSIMTTVVACLLPTVAITVLAKVHSMGLILGLIALFTAIFSVGLVLLSSSSSRVEIFTATAAFSAVMVVFVQNQIGSQ